MIIHHNKSLGPVSAWFWASPLPALPGQGGTLVIYGTWRLLFKLQLYRGENYKLKDGKWYRYNKDGILLKIEVYKKGKYIGDAQIEEE